MTLDLDAIQARADAATEGPWKLWGMSVLADHAGTSNVDDAIPVANTMSYPALPPRTGNAQFIAHAREDIPSLVSLVRELQASIPARVVLVGPPAEVEAALDALPVRAVVTSESLFSFDVFLKESQVSTRGSAWYQAGFSSPIESGVLARNYLPLVVIR